MIFEVDPDLTITYVAGRVEEIMERSAQDLIGKKITDLLDEAEIKRLQVLIKDSIKNKSIFNTVLTITEDQEQKYRHAIAKPVFGSNGKFLGFRGTYRDITKRKKLEKALEQQNWLLQVAIDSIDHCAFVLSDADNNVLKWNHEYEKLFNHSNEVLKTRDTLKYIAETRNKTVDPEQYDRDAKQAIRSRKTIVHTYQLLGSKVIERKVIPLYKDNVLIGRIAHIRDITNDKNRNSS